MPGFVKDVITSFDTAPRTSSRGRPTSASRSPFNELSRITRVRIPDLCFASQAALGEDLANRSEPGFLQARQETRLRRVRLPERANTLGDLNKSALPFADFAQVLEKRDRSVIVTRTLCGNERLDTPPRVCLTFRQHVQMTVTSSSLLTLATLALVRFAGEADLPPPFRQVFGSRTQCAGGAKRPRRRAL